MSSRWWAALLSRAPAPRFRAALATTIPLQHQPIHRRRLLPRYQGEFHRSAHDNQRQFTNSRYLGYDKGGGGGMKGILDHTEAAPVPAARPRDGASVRGALDYDAPVEDQPTVRHKQAGRPAPASEMSSLLAHGMAPVEQQHRKRDGGAMAALLAGEEPPAPVAGSSEALNAKHLPSAGRKPAEAMADDPRETAMQRLQYAHRELVKLLCAVGTTPRREHDGSLTAPTAKGVLDAVTAAGVHLSPQSAGALLALCDLRERPSWEEFLYALHSEQGAPPEPPGARDEPPETQPPLPPPPQQPAPLMTLQPGAPQQQQSEWALGPAARADAKRAALTPAELRAQVQAARAGGPGPALKGVGGTTVASQVGQEASAALAHLFNGGDANRHGRSAHLAAAAPTWYAGKRG